MVRDFDAQLPVHVRPGTTKDGREAWLIAPATAYWDDQILWLEKRLDAITRVKYMAQWLCRPEAAKQIMFKANGITTSYYIHWGQTRAPGSLLEVNGDANEVETDNKMSYGEESFIDYVCHQCGFSKKATVRFLFQQIRRAMVNWMIVEKHPVDLGFCKLHAFQLRANWLAIMTAKFPGFLKYRGESAQSTAERLAATTFQWCVERPEMASMHEMETVDWTLSVEPLEAWHKHAREYERMKYAEFGAQAYYRKWFQGVRKAYGRIVDTFESYFTQSSWPVADVDETLPVGHRALFWLLNKGCVRPAPATIPQTAYIAGERPTDGEPKRSPERAFKTFTEMPDVPDEDITKGILDMWNARRVE